LVRAFFFSNTAAPPEHSPLSLHAALPIFRPSRNGTFVVIRYSTVDRNGRPVTTTDYGSVFRGVTTDGKANAAAVVPLERLEPPGDRKSTRLNSSHEWISYAVFCLKKKR